MKNTRDELCGEHVLVGKTPPFLTILSASPQGSLCAFPPLLCACLCLSALPSLCPYISTLLPVPSTLPLPSTGRPLFAVAVLSHLHLSKHGHPHNLEQEANAFETEIQTPPTLHFVVSLQFYMFCFSGHTTPFQKSPDVALVKAGLLGEF